MLAKSRTTPPPAESASSPPVQQVALKPPPVPPASESPKAVEVPRETVSEKKKPDPPLVVSNPAKPEPPRDMGRGGAQHQAIQQRIKKAAEELGFRSVIEKQILDGQGSVDLWLERAEQSIACEISITTTIDHEVGNVAKCLKAELPNVVVICLDDERLKKIAAAVSGSLGAESGARVKYFQPDPFIAYLKSLKPPVAPPMETQYGGYKVKLTAPDLSPEELKQKEDIAHRLLSEAMRKKKK